MRLVVLSDQLTVSHGGPLPRRLADGTRAPPRGAACAAFRRPAMRPGSAPRFSPSFEGVSAPRGQVAHALLALPPLWAPILLPGLAVRLACLIHAASVRSEPESNSQKKIPPRATARAAPATRSGSAAGRAPTGRPALSLSFPLPRPPRALLARGWPADSVSSVCLYRLIRFLLVKDRSARRAAANGRALYQKTAGVSTPFLRFFSGAPRAAAGRAGASRKRVCTIRPAAPRVNNFFKLFFAPHAAACKFGVS